jgi:hypothetical protein
MDKVIAVPCDKPSTVSNQVLLTIAEHGFFGRSGCLAEARSACSELVFARSLIAAQTARIAELTRSGIP